MTAPRGERGPHGDHGQDGDMGLTGERGAQGERGAPADEHRVEVVEAAAAKNVRRLTFLFVSFVLAMGYFGWLLHGQDIATGRAAYDSCQARNVNRQATNAAWTQLAEVDQRLLNGPGTPVLFHQLSKERGAAYTQAVRPLEDCGHRP